jgi:RDD family.
MIYASGRRRFLAHLIDAFLLGGALGFGLALWVLANPSPELAAYLNGESSALPVITIPGWYWLFCLAAAWVYYVPFEVSGLQGSFGKFFAGIRMADLNGNPLTFGGANLRFVCKVAVGALYGAFAYLLSLLGALVSPLLSFALAIAGIYTGYIVVAKSPAKQDLHDKWSGVVLLRRDS